MSNNEWSESTLMASTAVLEGRLDEAEISYSQALSDARVRDSAKDIYNTLCNFSDVSMRLGKFEDAEKMLKEATALSFKHKERLGFLTAWVSLQAVLLTQNKLQEAEELCIAVFNNSLDKNGKESRLHMVNLTRLAKFYGIYLKNMNKCRSLFDEVIEWAGLRNDRDAANVVYEQYAQVLRMSGLKSKTPTLLYEVC